MSDGIADYMIGSLDPNDAPMHGVVSLTRRTTILKLAEPSMNKLMSDLFNNKPMRLGGAATTGHCSMPPPLRGGGSSIRR